MKMTQGKMLHGQDTEGASAKYMEQGTRALMRMMIMLAVSLRLSLGLGVRWLLTIREMRRGRREYTLSEMITASKRGGTKRSTTAA